MSKMSYSDYLNRLPEETQKYIRLLFRYLDNEKIWTLSEDNGKRAISTKSDILFLKSMIAYRTLGPDYRKFITKIGFSANDIPLEDEKAAYNYQGRFEEYYDALVPENENEIPFLLPEDIITRTYTKENARYLIEGPDEDFLSKLEKRSDNKKVPLMDKTVESYYKNIPISVINYYETAGKIYDYLDSKVNKSEKHKIEMTPENLRAISYLLSIFCYNHISSETENVDVKLPIVEYLNNIGLTKEKLEELVGVTLPNELPKPRRLSYTLLNVFDIKKLTNYGSSSLKIPYLIKKTIEDDLEKNYSFKNVLSIFDITKAQFMGFEDAVDERKKEESKDPDAIYKAEGLIPEVIKLAERVNQIYTYLTSEQQFLDKTFIKNDNDLRILAFLIAAYEAEYPKLAFFIDNGITLDKVLELVKLPNKAKLFEEINKTNSNKRFMPRVSYLVIGSRGNSNSNVTCDIVFSNLFANGYSESRLTQNIYRTVTGTALDNNFEGKVKAHLEQKSKLNQEELTEEIFADLSIDVYNYLKLVSDYYMLLKDKNLSQVDKEQLSIIFAASRYEKRMEQYLDSVNLSRNNIARLFNLSFDYKSFDMDIAAIDKVFRKYIFDRDPADITPHTIFMNAFEPKLTNTVNLRKALHTVGKKPEDFLDIDNTLEQFEQNNQEIKRQKSIDTVKSKLTSYSKELFDIATNVYDYLKANIPEIVETENELSALALMIAESYYEKSPYKPYFDDNGISTEFLLSLVGLNMDEFKKLLENKSSDDTLLKFEDFLIGSKEYNEENVLRVILNGTYGHLTKRIVELSGGVHSEVFDNIINKKEKKLTPQRTLDLLLKEDLQTPNGEDLGQLVRYGNQLTLHARNISELFQGIVFKGSVEESVKTINEALSGIVTKETVANEDVSVWDRWFGLPELTKEVKTYHPEKLDEVSESIDSRLETLVSELEDYAVIEKAIKLYLIKLDQQIKATQAKLDELNSKQTKSGDDIFGLIGVIEQNTARQSLTSQLDTLKTNFDLMKSEFMSIHAAMINHVITSNGLATAKNTIIPVIYSELAIAKGKKTESEAIELTGDLVGLLQGLVNNNVALTQQNLQKLRGSGLSLESINHIGAGLDAYIKSLEGTNNQTFALPETNQSQDQGSGEHQIKLTLDPNAGKRNE